MKAIKVICGIFVIVWLVSCIQEDTTPEWYWEAKRYNIDPPKTPIAAPKNSVFNANTASRTISDFLSEKYSDIRVIATKLSAHIDDGVLVYDEIKYNYISSSQSEMLTQKEKEEGCLYLLIKVNVIPATFIVDTIECNPSVYPPSEHNWRPHEFENWGVNSIQAVEIAERIHNGPYERIIITGRDDIMMAAPPPEIKHQRRTVWEILIRITHDGDKYIERKIYLDVQTGEVIRHIYRDDYKNTVDLIVGVEK